MCGLIWDLLALIVMACFWWLFPWISQTLDLTGTTVDSNPLGYAPTNSL